MEAGYGFHLIIRYFHDITYHKNKLYRAWTDKPYSDAVHKVTLTTIVATLFVFSLGQVLLPSLQNKAFAGAIQKVWTTLADFTNNNGATGNITSTNINLNNGDPKLTFGTGSITDDSAAIETLTIGTQVWMRKNLNVGTMIAAGTAQTNNAILEKHCQAGLESNCTTYGGLYQWGEAVQYLNGASNTTSPSPAFSGNVQGICPTGFHLPTDAELTTLTTYLGTTTACTQMKVGGSSGFNGLLAGYLYNGSFYYLGSHGYFWFSSEVNATDAWYGDLKLSAATVSILGYGKVRSFSVRCLKN